MKKMTAFSIFLCCFFAVNAQDKDLFEKQLFIQGEDTLRCRILTPVNFSPSKKYPLVVFLHGSGERGIDNEKQLTWGADIFLDSLNRNRYPAIVLFPQCPPNETWANTIRTEVKDSLGGFRLDTLAKLKNSTKLLLNFIDTLAAGGGIDKQRIYIGGLSMGGFGTFEILWRRPDLFAAAIAICGGGTPEKVSSYAPKLPIWVFHGDADAVVPVGNSRIMVTALRSAKMSVTYTEYPGINHDSWKNAFAEPKLMDWIFSQKKKVK
jgi:predicted peptidase